MVNRYLKASVTFCRSRASTDDSYEYWDPEERPETSSSSEINTPPPEEQIPDDLFNLNSGSFGDTLELDDPSEMGNILSKVLRDTFAMRGIPPPNYDGNAAEIALRSVDGPSVWDEQVQRTEEVYYSDQGSDNPDQSIYGPVCEPLTPQGIDCVTEFDTVALRKQLGEKEKKLKQCCDENAELRSRLNRLANILRREAWKRRKLACEALTARFCLNISDKMVKQRDELLRMATRNYATLAYLTHKFSVEEEIQRKTNAITDILSIPSVAP